MKKRISSALALLLAVSLLAGCGKSKEVRAVEKSIASIGEVTEEAEAAIGDARAQYEALPEEERESVSNYETLQEAEKRLEELRRLAEINAIREKVRRPLLPLYENMRSPSAARDKAAGRAADMSAGCRRNRPRSPEPPAAPGSRQSSYNCRVDS